jgi:hypothetical protein
VLRPFTSRFPELGMKETRVAIFPDEDDPMMGRYAFIELYCDDEACDCRRVIFQVVDESDPSKILASINYGWESPEYYARWMGSSEDARKMAGATLDPLLPQSSHSRFFLKFLNGLVLRDPAYVERLKRHYAMFKSVQQQKTRAGSPKPPNPSWRKKRPKLGARKRRKRPR